MNVLSPVPGWRGDQIQTTTGFDMKCVGGGNWPGIGGGGLMGE